LNCNYPAQNDAVGGLHVQDGRVWLKMIEIFHEYKKAELGISATNCHIAGHSLGAHLAGYAGQQLQQCGHKLGRITGESTSSATWEPVQFYMLTLLFFFRFRVGSGRSLFPEHGSDDSVGCQRRSLCWRHPHERRPNPLRWCVNINQQFQSITIPIKYHLTKLWLISISCVYIFRGWFSNDYTRMTELIVWNWFDYYFRIWTNAAFRSCGFLPEWRHPAARMWR